MNTDGFVLLERVLAGDVQAIQLVDKCAAYARTKKDVELIRYNDFRSGDKIYADQISAYVLSRLLNNLS